ncbi:MAG: Rieske 2Fe-2S domain-containing protein [Burkholderiaceae bacterium]
MFPVNAWYVACTPDEVQERPLGRMICGQRVCLFRGADGQVSAVEDFCPHRGAPLSLGTLEHGVLTCGYHGLRMGCDGQAIAMPGQRVERFPANRRFAIAERFGFVWIWPGEYQAANPDTIPKPAWADRPDWAVGGGMFNVKCDYRLLIDNLMDLTHETYIHRDSIGQKEIDESPPVTSFEANEVTTERQMTELIAPPFWASAMASHGLDPTEKVDRWQVCRFVAPSNVLIDVGVALTGRGGLEANPADKVSGIVVDYITPETETSCWYFWGMARHFRADDKDLTESIREGQQKIFTEDLEMLERQQQNLSENPDRPLLKLNIDAGGVHARRIIKQLCEQEVQ